MFNLHYFDMKTLIYWIRKDARVKVCETLGLPTWENVNGRTVIDGELTEHQTAELERLQEKNYLKIQKTKL